MTFYNELEPYAAEWLRRLVAAGHVAPGEVNAQDIRTLTPDQVRGKQCHFFAGIGCWSRALRLAGVADDANVWTGSPPCQPFSQAGRKAGVEDSRHLWPAWYALIQECRPAIIFGEQVSSPAGLAWFDAVQADLEAAEYAVGVADLCAASVGAPHIRQRLYFVALADDYQRGRPLLGPSRIHAEGEPGDDTAGRREDGGRLGSAWLPARWVTCSDGKQRPLEPGTEPLVDGATARVGRLRAYGNAIVAPLAAEFIRAALGG